MTDALAFIGAIAALVALVSWAYHRARFLPLPEARPSWVWFPKYRFAVAESPRLHDHLLSLGFKPAQNAAADAPAYLRAPRMRNFSASALTLHLRRDPVTGDALLGALLFGVVADRGHIWSVAREIADFRPNADPAASPA